jgi:hypothetical protein
MQEKMIFIFCSSVRGVAPQSLTGRAVLLRRTTAERKNHKARL